MTPEQVKQFFSVNYGVKAPSKPEKGKKHGIGFYLILLITVIGLIIFIVLKVLNKNAWAAYRAEIEKRKMTWGALFNEHAEKFFSKDQAIQRALKKNDIDESQLVAKCIFFRGEQWKKNQVCQYDGKAGDWISASQQWNVVLFTDTQMILYTYTHNFWDGSDSDKSTEGFYSDVATIKTEDGEHSVSEDKVIHTNDVIVNIMGDKLTLSLLSLNDEVEEAIKGMKNVLRERKAAK